MRIDRHHQFMLDFTRSWLLSLRQPVFVYLTSLSLTVIILFSSVFYLIEDGINSKLAGFFDAFYFTVTVMTGVGLGDIVPVTTAGKAVAMAMMLCGTGIFVSFSAVLAASIIEIGLKHKRGDS